MASINKTSSKPYYEQLMLSIKQEVLIGVLQPGDKLPSIREMAHQLGMNPNTVSKAYKMLELQEVILTIKGKGTYIKKIDSNSRNEKKIHQLKKQFNDLIIEASYLNITKQELESWLNEMDITVGGEKNET